MCCFSSELHASDAVRIMKKFLMKVSRELSEHRFIPVCEVHQTQWSKNNHLLVRIRHDHLSNDQNHVKVLRKSNQRSCSKALTTKSIDSCNALQIMRKSVCLFMDRKKCAIIIRVQKETNSKMKVHYYKSCLTRCWIHAFLIMLLREFEPWLIKKIMLQPTWDSLHN